MVHRSELLLLGNRRFQLALPLKIAIFQREGFGELIRQSVPNKDPTADIPRTKSHLSSHSKSSLCSFLNH